MTFFHKAPFRPTGVASDLLTWPWICDLILLKITSGLVGVLMIFVILVTAGLFLFGALVRDRYEQSMPIRLVKNTEGQAPTVRSDKIDQNRWLRAVRGWVREFKQHARNESAPVFDRVMVEPNPERPPSMRLITVDVKELDE